MGGGGGANGSGRTASANGGGAASRRESSIVTVLWRQLPSVDLEAAHAAREIVEVVTGYIQRRLDAPQLLLPAAAPRDDDPRWVTTQSAEPISYVAAAERLVAILGDFGGPATHALTDRGRQLALEPRARRRARRTVRGVGETSQTENGAGLGASHRGPSVIHVRPGSGGAQRRLDFVRDPLAGLDAWGELLWWPVPGSGTMLGLISRDPNGNAAGLCRLSGEDRDDTLVDQVQKAVALEAANPERISIRYILLAVNMSGTREVRPPRAMPAPPGLLERDDILLLEKWFGEGWVEHVIWRDGRRIAREILPAEQILQSLRRNRVNLWLSSYGRMIDWNSDKLGIRALNMVSAEDRDNIDRSLQEARLRRGPLAGDGWRNSPPRFGFIKHAKTLERLPDPEQWPWILRAFELADTGDHDEPAGLSTRKLAAALAAEGCPFDHERLRQILRDPIYATGEWEVKVRGVSVAQRPIALPEGTAVPIDRFLRVSGKLALRKGSTKRTPLGEFLFNYVETVHKQCEGDYGNNGSPVLVKGNIVRGREHQRILHHSPTAGRCSARGRGLRGAFTWDRDELQTPVVEALRELVTHPEVLAQAALAVRHEISASSPRLTAEQRAQLEHELAEIDQRQEAAAEEWVDRAIRDSGVLLADYDRIAGALRRRRETIERRLAADEAASSLGDEPSRAQGAHDLKEAFLEIMTVETPADPQLLALRARLFQCCVSKLIIDDDGEPTAPITITIEGHLVPDPSAAVASPLVAAGDVLRSYITARDGRLPEAERHFGEVGRVQGEVAEVAPDVETAYEYGYHKAVSTLQSHFFSTNRSELRAVERRQLDNLNWARRRYRMPLASTAAWRATVQAAPKDMEAAVLARRLGHTTAIRIYQEIERMGEACVRDVADAMSVSNANVRIWINRLHAEGEIKRVRGYGAGGSTGFYAVSVPAGHEDCPQQSDGGDSQLAPEREGH